jgi:hypothetical protein
MIRKSCRAFGRLLIVFILLLSIYSKVYDFKREIAEVAKIYKNIHSAGIRVNWRIPEPDRVIHFLYRLLNLLYSHFLHFLPSKL